MSHARPVGLLVFVALVTVLGTSCRSAGTSDVSLRLRQLTTAKPPAGTRVAVWKDVAAFYEAREFVPAWVTDRGVAKSAAQGIAALGAAESHGLPVETYGANDLARLIASLEDVELEDDGRVARLSDVELNLTRALLTLGRDIAVGRGRPQAVNPLWKSQRTPPNLPATLIASIESDVSTWPESVQPPHEEYVALRRALTSLRAWRDRGGWPKVRSVRLQNGRRHDAVVGLRARLRASGDLVGDPPRDARLVDPALKQAVRSFQAHHGLPESGALDERTLAAMNVPIDRRIAQIELNLERWRWMTNDLGARHLFVNIPAYHLTVRERGLPVRDIRVVIGRTGDETPVFSDLMTTVVFSPYWNIPEAIAFDETLPAHESDSEYLALNNIEIIRTGSPSEVIDPSTIDWNDPAALAGLSFRQRPGPGNALGHVKFVFPNPFNVYIHDTPADSYFEQPERAFSHGCVRLEEPETLAKYLLGDRREWTDAAIGQAMHTGIERHVKLAQPVPTHIVYFTAWIDPNGGLHFRDDVYGYDARQLQGWRRTTSRTS